MRWPMESRVSFPKPAPAPPKTRFRIYNWNCCLAGRAPKSEETPEKGLQLDFDVHAHAARGALHRIHSGFDGEAVEIRHLDLGDFFHMLERDLADAVLVGLGRALGDGDGALDQ